MRLRILFGVLLLVLGLTGYALAVMVAAVRLLPQQWAIEAIFYAAAGMLWIPPAARLVRWMQRARAFRPPPFG
jgi:hypothetical protein